MTDTSASKCRRCSPPTRPARSTKPGDCGTRSARDNVMIKVPATPQGIPAIQQLISEGINVNVTLLFAQDAYEQVAEAYIVGPGERGRARR